MRQRRLWAGLKCRWLSPTLRLLVRRPDPLCHPRLMRTTVARPSASVAAPGRVQASGAPGLVGAMKGAGPGQAIQPQHPGPPPSVQPPAPPPQYLEPRGTIHFLDEHYSVHPMQHKNYTRVDKLLS